MSNTRSRRWRSEREHTTPLRAHRAGGRARGAHLATMARSRSTSAGSRTAVRVDGRRIPVATRPGRAQRRERDFEQKEAAGNAVSLTSCERWRRRTTRLRRVLAVGRPLAVAAPLGQAASARSQRWRAGNP